MERKYVIIGGVAAGASVAARLRRLDEQAKIIMIDKGDYVSFSNCSLPYRIGGVVKSDEDLVLMNPKKFLNQYNIEVRVLNEAIKIDEDKKVVIIKDLKEDKEYNETFDKLILAPGASAIVPPFNGLEKMENFVLKTVNDVTKVMNFIEEKKPKHMTVVGGGFIGVEVAENLIEKNIEVTLVEGSNQLLAPFDFEMSLYANNILRDKGVNIITNNLVDSFDENNVFLKDGTNIVTDGVILSIGIKPETKFLEDSSIDLAKSGHIIVNDNYQTTNSDIYAAGDAILVKNQLTGQSMPLALAGPANKQGRLIADHINGRKILNKGYIGSSVIKIFDYTFASTGLNEKQIKNMEEPFDYEITYGAPADKVSLMPNVNKIITKLIFEKKTGKILGAQAISKGSSDKRIDVVASLIKMDGTVFDLADVELVYAPWHSTGKDAINKMGYQASELVLENFDKLRFDDVYDLIESKAQIIDVREVIEYEKSHIKGSKNIPMSEFRKRLDEIDKSRAVYLNCGSGQRSYNVTLALKQLGYDAKNILGGFTMISNYEKEMQKLNKTRKNIIIGE